MRARIDFRFTPLLLGSLLAAGVAGPALAQTGSPAQALLDDKFVASMGLFVVQSDVTARLNGQSSTNPDVDFDKTFGKPSDATRFRADALWRITPTHHMRMMYFKDDVTRSATLSQDVKWGDYTFLAGGGVQSERKTSIFELAYEYAFMRQPTYEVAGTFGVHYTDLSLKLSGSGQITDGSGNTTTGVSKSVEGSAPVPLPVIGLRAGWVVAPQWYIDGQVQFFKVNVNGVDGSLSDLRAGATWMFNPNFGLGLGYNRFYTKVDVSKDSYNGNVKFGYSGFQAYLTGAF
ncbi:MAG: hypothetical protein JHC40_05825 [Burkholderiales bacterium]|nr:hypothetical protein [Burkholderiales bacterium]